jgi:rare lipoprotein A
MQTNTQCNARHRHRPFTAAALMLLTAVAGITAQGTESSHANSDHASRTHKWMQIGKASWYGRRFQGHRTASGEAFDLHMFTCAHRTLPIGSLLRVTNLMNRRSIMVRVNDRGPVPQGVIVDLSYGAARSLGFSRNGNVRVRLEKVDGAEAAQLDWPELNRPELNRPTSLPGSR